jgi:hypothetical protein
MPELADVSIRSIQRSCLKELNLPSRKRVKTPHLTERMMQQRLDLSTSTSIGQQKSGSRSCSAMKAI